VDILSLIAILVLFAPFVVILFFANLAERRREAGVPGTEFAAVSYLLLLLIYSVLVMLGLITQVVGMVVQSSQAANATADTISLATMAGIGPAWWIPSIFGVLLLLPPVRRLLAHALPIDPASTVHAVALSYTMLVAVNLLATVAFGLGNMANLLESGAAESSSTVAASLWIQTAIWLILAVIGVGWVTRRGLRQTLVRLGIAVPKWRQVAIGLAVGLAMAVVAGLATSLTDRLGLGSNEVDRLSESLVGPLTQSPLGILTLGLAAGIGEETLFRGALQPRFGLLLATLVFALLHSQYGFSVATVIVFIVGLILGILRQRENTSTSIVCHATYNVALVMLSLLSIF
jgi:membrane protease YdiL (CAAX protease family)